MRIVVPLIAIIALGSCALTPQEHDDLCDELAYFADSTGPTESHAVTFTTDWSIRPDPEDPDRLVWGTKSCNHGNYEAGRRLCAYLLKHTSTEFAVTNYKGALRCLNVPIKPDTSESEDLPSHVKSLKVLGKRLRSELTVAFSAGNEDDLPRITISATGSQ